MDKYLLERMANAIRFLTVDAVENAQSGHPGMPLGMADVATVLFSQFLKFDASAPNWPDRDRFILSAGHGSMLIYSLSYLLGYDDICLEDLKQFRQLGAKTAGHPEFGHAPAVETTTGPLGQGLANAVGFAIAEAHLAATFGSELVDHYTYVFAGDGCLMEGVSQEAISLAGHLKLSKLIVFWDDNDITIDGSVGLSDSTDQLQRFAASGWNVTRINGHDFEEIADSIEMAKASDRPTLIACKTVIGYGAPNRQGTAKIHGSPLGADEISEMRSALSWSYDPFELPSDVRESWLHKGHRQEQERLRWEQRLSGHPKGNDFISRLAGADPGIVRTTIETFKRALADTPQDVAGRAGSQMVLEALTPQLPSLLGGSADLTGSNNTRTPDLETLDAKNYAGRYIHYGIREHGMVAAMNGLALHGSLVPYGGTFMVFSDYARGALRLAALMGIQTIFVFTHDSIGLGEDGPTHQPVEHLSALRAIPGLDVYRPADIVETAECWEAALKRTDGPSALILSRQKLPQLRLDYASENLALRGAYVIKNNEAFDVTLLATGSEVSIAIKASETLSEAGITARVVSMPCWERFAAQPESYREQILGDKPRIGIEAALRQGWDRWGRGLDGFIGLETFGASGKGPELFDRFGLTSDAITAVVTSRLATN